MANVNDEGGFGRFGVYSRVELERFFHLDDEDRRLIAARRRDYNRLGFSLQVVTVRHLGMFLPDPLDVPLKLVEYLAEQLGIEDPSCVKRYTDREKTRLEHAWEIQREYGLTPFTEVEPELRAWIADQAWLTGEGPKAILSGAVGWLRGRQALLPAGVTTLERMVAAGREAADQRLWQQLSSALTPPISGALLRLLEVSDVGKRRGNELDRLRKGLFRSPSRWTPPQLRIWFRFCFGTTMAVRAGSRCPRSRIHTPGRKFMCSAMNSTVATIRGRPPTIRLTLSPSITP